jgi:signal transduction histidine kinase
MTNLYDSADSAEPAVERPQASERLRPRVSTRESLRFLTEAGSALAASLDYAVTLQRVAELTVPRIACYCELVMIEDGRVRRVGQAHVDPRRGEELAHIELFPVDPDSPGPLAEVLRTGEALLVSPWAPGSSEPASPYREHLELLRLLEATSFLLIPLVARERPLGALLLASTRTDRFYGPQDLALARELARIAGMAIDNARLYSDAHEAIRARDEILRVVSHDLRNPIGAITSAASFVLEEGPEEVREGTSGRMLNVIHNASRQAMRMIDDLLDVSRIETGPLTVSPVPEPVAPIFEEALEIQRPLARNRGISLDWNPAEPLPRVMVERERILQLLGNLLGNAIKFTPEGGRIEVGASANAQEVLGWVADSGPGIPPDQVPHVFDRFWQASRTDRRGIGLGLAIVQGIAEAHGGRVWVESQPGRGARILFTLPAAP